jgi:hypothetical protein
MGNINPYRDATTVELQKEEFKSGSMRLGLKASSSKGEPLGSTPPCTIRYSMATRRLNCPPIDYVFNFIGNYLYWTRYDLLFEFLFNMFLTSYPFTWQPFLYVPRMFFTWDSVEMAPGADHVTIEKFPRHGIVRLQTRNDGVPWFWRQYGAVQIVTAVDLKRLKSS